MIVALGERMGVSVKIDPLNDSGIILTWNRIMEIF